MPELVRWGILSTAGIGRAFVRGVGKSRVCCVQAVASRAWTRANEWAKDHGVPRAFGSYEELIESDEIDLIYNPLPNGMHAEWTIKAIEAGKPVLCEKPFTSNAAEARNVARAAAKQGLPVAEAFMYRHHPMYDQVASLIQAGTIGELTSLRAEFAFRLGSRDNIRTSAELAGGALMDVGCYCVNVARLITGNEPTRVSAFERRTTVDDTLAGLMEFPGGFLAQFECSIENSHRRSVEIVGTLGTIQLPNPWTPGEEQGTIIVSCGGTQETVRTPGADCYQLEADDFACAWRDKRPVRWPVEDAIANMTVIDALYKAARHGKVVELHDKTSKSAG